MEFNEIQKLRDQLLKRFSDGAFHLTPPLREADIWTLDITRNGRWLASVTWMAPDHFGVSKITDEVMYGDGPDEVLSDYEKVVEWATSVLSAGAPDKPLE